MLKANNLWAYLAELSMKMFYNLKAGLHIYTVWLVPVS